MHSIAHTFHRKHNRENTHARHVPRLSEMTTPQNSGTPRPIALAAPHSGQAMDRAVERRRPLVRYAGIAGGVLALLAGVLWFGFKELGTRSFAVGSDRVVISAVEQGTFEDFIPIRGRVTPRRTVYLDAIEGGRVEQRLVEDGATVAAGDLIVVLSNTSLQLDVTRNEAMVTEQLNNMRTIELQLEQNRLQHKRNLVELDYQIKRLGRQIGRLSNLNDAGVAARSQLEDAGDELEYFENRRTVTLESQSTDARMQETQLAFLRDSAAQLERNLAFSRQNLDALNVRAPVAGKLSGLDVEVGQSINRGGRLGQIDDPDSFKLSAGIDEYYLGRVDIGQTASVELDNARHALEIIKIYPQVQSGQFQVDLVFEGEEPRGIRRGQSLQARLTLGDAAPALLVPNGAFYQDTGGQWMFVVSADGAEAVRRNVRLGRRNSRYIEVLEGLERGERVVTSPYSGFKDVERLKLGD